MARNGHSPLDEPLWSELVRFLHDWLPPIARERYRELIAAYPGRWTRHPHFANGVIVRHALRGNGVTEELVGAACLESVWPRLLEAAVKEDGTPLS